MRMSFEPLFFDMRTSLSMSCVFGTVTPTQSNVTHSLPPCHKPRFPFLLFHDAAFRRFGPHRVRRLRFRRHRLDSGTVCRDCIVRYKCPNRCSCCNEISRRFQIRWRFSRWNPAGNTAAVLVLNLVSADGRNLRAETKSVHSLNQIRNVNRSYCIFSYYREDSCGLPLT